MSESAEKPRTSQQNRALHLWCNMLAEALNDAGYDFKQFLEVSEYQLEVPWTPQLVKDQLWRPVQQAMTGKESTTEMNTIDPTPVHESVMKRVSEVTGVEYIPWPDRWGNDHRKATPRIRQPLPQAIAGIATPIGTVETAPRFGGGLRSSVPGLSTERYGEGLMREPIYFVEIVGARDPLMWYAGKAGDFLPVYREEEDIYWSREDAGFWNFIYKSDAVRVEHTTK